MESFNGYIFSVVCIVILSGICSIIMPEGKLKKYVNLVVGILIVTTIIKPVFSAKDLNFDGLLAEMEQDDIINAQENYNEKLSENFAVNISADISGYVLDNYNCKSTVKATPLLNSNKNIEGIKEVTIVIHDGQVSTKMLMVDISQRYGINKENIIIRGGS